MKENKVNSIIRQVEGIGRLILRSRSMYRMSYYGGTCRGTCDKATSMVCCCGKDIRMPGCEQCFSKGLLDEEIRSMIKRS